MKCYGYDKTDAEGHIFMQTANVVCDMILTDRHVLREMIDELYDEYIFGFVMTQFSLNKGLTVHDKSAKEAVVKELT